jgi:hypothetical protein
MFVGGVLVNRRKAGFDCVKFPLLFLGFFWTLSAISQAGPVRGGFGGRGLHTGFAARGMNSASVHGGRFNGAGFRGRFFRRNRPVFVQSFGWPGYCYPYPYTDPLSYSYLEPDSDPDYQYWDNSSTNVRPEATNRAVPQTPVIVVVNGGNPRPRLMDSSTVMDPRGNTDPRVDADPRAGGGYINNGYNFNGYNFARAAGQQRMVVPDPTEYAVASSITPGDPVVPQPTPGLNTQAPLQPGTGVFGKFVIVSWLKDQGKDVISVKNIETNAVQRITSQPNIDHFRIVEIHPNADLKQFEAIISNGSDQGAVRFQF